MQNFMNEHCLHLYGFSPNFNKRFAKHALWIRSSICSLFYQQKSIDINRIYRVFLRTYKITQI